ncbi:hypothetical protein [Plantactinospora sp. WMMB782]|uniref:hypothetical protein n=1 Tax=Plantactinospora sp. WMMB782 TaxID=3404121 RepID=UPI003B92D7A8
MTDILQPPAERDLPTVRAERIRAGILSSHCTVPTANRGTPAGAWRSSPLW